MRTMTQIGFKRCLYLERFTFFQSSEVVWHTKIWNMSFFLITGCFMIRAFWMMNLSLFHLTSQISHGMKGRGFFSMTVLLMIHVRHKDQRSKIIKSVSNNFLAVRIFLFETAHEWNQHMGERNISHCRWIDISMDTMSLFMTSCSSMNYLFSIKNCVELTHGWMKTVLISVDNYETALKKTHEH